MAKLFSDLKLYDWNTENPIIITVDQFAKVIANNEPDDIIGVEADLQAIIDTQRHNTRPFYIYITSLNPFHITAGNNYELLKKHG